MIMFERMRLLCMGSKDNTEVVVRLVDRMISFNGFFHHVTTIIRGNRYFGEEFQKKGWFNLLMEKLAFLQTIESYQSVWDIY